MTIASTDQSATDFSRFLFARGFCISEAPLSELPQHFESYRVDSIWIAHDKTSSFAASTLSKDDDKYFICLIGLVVDCLSQSMDVQKICDALLDALIQGETQFHERIDWLSGRYVIIYKNSAGISILADAAATRSVFYTRSGPRIAASHFNLVRNMAGTGPSRAFLEKKSRIEKQRTYGYPGITTPDENIAVLTANTLLRWQDRRIERFYPRAPLPQITISEALEILVHLFKCQLDVLVPKRKVFVSLTAGIDSRVTLSAMRPWKNQAVFFSYFSKEAHRVDVQVAKDIAAKVDLPYILLDVSGNKRANFDAFCLVAETNNYHSHERLVAYEYTHRIAPAGIHLRSNLFEIARSFWRKHRKRNDNMSAFDMAQCFYSKCKRSDTVFIEAFEEFQDTVGLSPNLYGFDPYDLFYWEHRMSAWHGMVVLEADPACDTYIIFNCRKCIEAALGLPYRDRAAGRVFEEFITKCWPELNNWPINPKHFPSRRALYGLLPSWRINK